MATHDPSRRRLLRATLAVGAGSIGIAAPGATLAGCSRDWRVLPERVLRLATGNPGGVFDAYGQALARVVPERLPTVGIQTVSTDASVENARLVARGEADLGFSLGDIAADAVEGDGDFARPLRLMAMTRTYDSFVHLVVRESADIEVLTDLEGTRVGIGSPKSGTRVVALRLMRLAGVPLHTVRMTGRTLQFDAAGLLEDDLDAFFFVSGLPNAVIEQLATRLAIRLIPLRELVSPMAELFGPEYVHGPIPASTYGLADGIDTLSVKNYLLANPELDPDLGYAFTRVLFEAQDAITAVAPDIRQPTVAAGIFTSPLPLHPGALRYFRELRD